jgi:DNA-binding GntR family transcriptional regulator
MAKSNLRRQVVDCLFDYIARGDFRPGERLVEWRLAKTLGISQSTLREALIDLEHKGLVVRKGRLGTFVLELSHEEMEQVYAVRIKLEPYAAALASQRMTEEDYLQLRILVDEIKSASDEGNSIRVSHADARFHQALWELSGNDCLKKMLVLVYQPLWAFELIWLYSAPTYDFGKTVREHEELLEVLRRRNSEEVQKTFESMLKLFCSQDLQNLRAHEVKESPTHGDKVAREGRRRKSLS